MSTASDAAGLSAGVHQTRFSTNSVSTTSDAAGWSAGAPQTWFSAKILSTTSTGSTATGRAIAATRGVGTIGKSIPSDWRFSSSAIRLIESSSTAIGSNATVARRPAKRCGRPSPGHIPAQVRPLRERDPQHTDHADEEQP